MDEGSLDELTHHPREEGASALPRVRLGERVDHQAPEVHEACAPWRSLETLQRQSDDALREVTSAKPVTGVASAPSLHRRNEEKSSWHACCSNTANMTVDDDDDLLREFLVESAENLDRLDQDFVALERDPVSRDRLGSIFRTVHTIKGTSGFLGLTKLEALTHAGEAMLSRLRTGKLVLDGAMTTALLAMVDGVRDILASLAASRIEGSRDIEPIVEELARAGGTARHGRSASTARRVLPADERADFGLFDAPSMEGRAPLGETTIRVDVNLLDQVMNMVGELVLARNQILEFGGTVKDPSFAKASQRLDLLTSELQEGIMKTRMQPIANVWNRFPRVVRDLASALGKQVDLELHGMETELDRTIIEAIKDPLTHIVRNAIDHGIESPAARRAAGKAEAGRLSLRAFHEGGQVNIEISDDGAGLDLARIRARAIERRLTSVERAAHMSERDVMQLVFEPGFSTAEQVTKVSGRGVGMDVVRTNIETVGGTVDVASRPGAGTTLKIKIPLTLAIIPALVVRSSSEKFAIPQVNLLELVRLEGGQARRGIEHVHGSMLYRLRGSLLPLVFLDRALELAEGSRSADEPVNIVVLQADDRRFGLVVDEIRDTQEIVVKPLGKELNGIGVFAGATIMGDGRVALILDVLGLARHAGVVFGGRDWLSSERTTTAAETEPASVDPLLLFHVGGVGRMAIPLSMVSRIEELETGVVEKTSGHDIVQYRGELLTLLTLARFFGKPSAPAERLQVIVCAAGPGVTAVDQSVGFVVDQILDVVENTTTARRPASRPGVLGTVVVQGKVAELLDVQAVIRMTQLEARTPSEAA